MAEEGDGVVRRLYTEFITIDRSSATIAAASQSLDSLEAQTEEAGAGLEELGNTAGNTGDEIQAQTQKTDGLRNALLALGAAFTAAGIAGMTYFSNVAKEYGRFATAQTAYVTMIGEGADQMLADLQQATKGAVAEYDLILAANRAVAMGISEDALPRLAEIAEAAARIMGTDTTSLFSDIVTGIARGSPLILDNLGIVVSIGEANERYAASIGKASDALTEEEQQAALLNEVLIQGQSLIDNAGTAGTTTAGAYAQMTAAVENLNIAMGAAASGPMSAWYELLANLANMAANLPAPLLAIVSGVGLLGSAASSIIGPLMLQAAALMFLRQQWVAFRAEMATTPAFSAIASVSLGGLTASLYATAAAAWAALVPLLPLIGAIAAVAGVGLALDYGVRGDESLIGSLLSPAATSDTLTSNTVNVTQYNTITQENEITTSQPIADADIDAFMRKSKARLAAASDEALQAGLTAYL